MTDGATSAEAVVELGKTTSKRKTYRTPETKAFTGMFERFGSAGRARAAE